VSRTKNKNYFENLVSDFTIIILHSHDFVAIMVQSYIVEAKQQI